jgi:4-azaleucine resistance transporter AzlC
MVLSRRWPLPDNHHTHLFTLNIGSPLLMTASSPARPSSADAPSPAIQAETPPATRAAEFWAGVRAVLPLVLGAIPFGILFGALAIEARLSPMAALGMSMFVFAGSSQFVGATLVKTLAPIPVIVLITLVVNLRHALYSATLAPRLKHLGQRWLLPLGFMLTDEAFAVTVQRFESQHGSSPHRHWYMLGAELAMYLNWQLCTLIGILAGSLLGDTSGLGLDFAMSVTFIGIVVPLIRTRPMLLAALAAGVVSLLTYQWDYKLGLMLAAGAGIAAGFIAETLKEKHA